ncbi:hypothetical protein D3C72_1281770 [compost metagenome]
MRARWARRPAPASTRRKARRSRCWTPRPASTWSRARRPTRSWSACSRRSRRSASSCCANRPTRRRSSCGACSATCSTTSPSTSSRSPVRRLTWTWPSAGASAGTRARSRTGRPPAGSRWPSGSRKMSMQARRCRTPRCPPGCSAAPWPRTRACMAPRVLGRRRPARSSSAPNCRCTSARCSARRCAALTRPIHARLARLSKRTMPCASGPAPAPTTYWWCPSRAR